MRTHLMVLMLALGPRVLAAPHGPPGVATYQGTAQRSVWDGVYTEDQAARGRTAYALSCSGCHSMSLEGGDDGQPPLTGIMFRSRWNGSTLGSLFETMRENMPSGRPGSLSPQVYADILSFLLKSNEMPAGGTELSPVFDALTQTVFLEKPAGR